MSYAVQTHMQWTEQSVMAGQHVLPTGEVAYDLEPLYYDRLGERMWEITAHITYNPYRRDYHATLGWQKKQGKTFHDLQDAKTWVEAQVQTRLQTMVHPA